MAIIQFPENDKGCCIGGSMPITLTLPVASRPLARIRFDPIEGRMGALSPDRALNWLEENLRRKVAVAVVDIAGPGDPLAEIESTVETLHGIRQHHPDIVLSLTTLGIHAEKYAGILGDNGVSRVTLLVDAVNLEVAGKLYAWIRPDRKTIPVAQATAILMAEQRSAVKAFMEAGCSVTIRSTVYPGFNDGHIETIAEVMAGYGAESMALMPYQPAGNKDEVFLVPPGRQRMQRLVKEAGTYMPTTLVAEKQGATDGPAGGAFPPVSEALRPKPTPTRANVAVVSSTGMEVDLHLGEAYQVLIYGPREDGLACLLGTRPVPEPGSGSSRWQELAESLPDCFALLAASAGESPRRILGKHGITVLITDNEIEGTVDVLYGGGKKGKIGKR